jgi:hypothetical protein
MNEQLIGKSLAHFKDKFDWPVLEETVQTNSGHTFRVFELDYFKNGGLHTLDNFGEGKFYIGNLQVERRYVRSGCTPEEQKIGLGDKFTYYTRITNLKMEDKPVC